MVEDKPPVQIAGVEGNSAFPGAVKNRRNRKQGAKRFRRFPSYKLKHGGELLDRDAVKLDFMASPFHDWEAFCASRGYDPAGLQTSPRLWEREKKYREAWNGIRADLEKAAIEAGPAQVMRAVRAAKQVPEALAAMLQVCHYAVSIHGAEAQADQAYLARCKAQGVEPDRARFRFSAGPQDLFFLSTALKQTTEGLYKSLGIDQSAGVDPDQWMRMLDAQFGKMEQQQAKAGEEKVEISVQVLGSEDARGALQEAITRYFDRPVPPATVVQLAPPPPEDEDDLAADDGTEPEAI